MKVGKLVSVDGGRVGGPTAVSIPLLLYSSAALVTDGRDGEASSHSVIMSCRML